MKRACLLGVALVIAGPATAEDWTIDRFQWSGSTKPGASIEIVNHHGDVRTRSSGINEVEILANIQHAPGDPYEAEIRVSDTSDPFGIEVEWNLRDGASAAESTPEMAKRRVDVTVIVPRTSRLTVRTTTGLVEAKGHGAAVVAESEDGEIRISTEGAISARSQHGSIDAVLGSVAPDSSSVFETTTGDIAVWLPGDASATVAAETLGVISTDYSIDIRRDESDGRKHATAVIGGGGAQLKIQTVRGQVRLFRTPK
jgi:hypothetical protein